MPQYILVVLKILSGLYHNREGDTSVICGPLVLFHSQIDRDAESLVD
jgi:hypothetical protein